MSLYNDKVSKHIYFIYNIRKSQFFAAKIDKLTKEKENVAKHKKKQRLINYVTHSNHVKSF